MKTTTTPINRRFYAGLPTLLDNCHALAGIEHLSREEAGYLHSCTEAASVSLAFILETAALLAESNRTGSKMVEADDAARFIADLAVTVAGLNCTLSELADNLSHRYHTAE